MRVRRATASDAMAIAVVHVRSWQAAYCGLVPQDYLDSLDPAGRRERWERAASDGQWPRAGVLVGEGDEGVTGFSHHWPTPDEDLDPALTGELHAIYLAPGAWGHGIGRGLMAAVLDVLAQAGCQQAALWVMDANERARRIYAAAGWRPDGAVKSGSSRGFPVTEVRYRRQLP